MNSQHPNHPNDNPDFKNDGQPVSPNASTNLNHSDNFIDATEDGLFDFDLDDLEKFFNTNTASAAPPSASTAHVDNPSQPLPALDLSTTSLDTHGLQADKNHLASKNIAPAHITPEPIVPEHSDAGINFEKSWDIPSPDIASTHTHNSSDSVHEPMPVVDTPTADTPFPDLSVAQPVALGTTTVASIVAAHSASTTPPNDTQHPNLADPIALTKNNPSHPVSPDPVQTTHTQPKQEKKGFFSSFNQKEPQPVEPTIPPPNSPTNASAGGAGNNYTPPPTLTTTKKPNKNNKPLLILLGLLGVGALAWVASQFLSEPEPVPAQKPIPASKAVSTTAGATPISTPASTVTATSSTTTTVISSPATTAVSSIATSSPLGTKTIKPEEILAAPLPKDNAVAKEEIDRLGDQSKQLSQQEKMMEEQLKMMNELNGKKEERIALLEKQIAQIEAQKGQAKK